MKYTLLNKITLLLLVLLFPWSIYADDKITSSVKWEVVPGASAYIVEIKDSFNTIILKKETDLNSLEFSLDKVSEDGYKVRITPVNKFGKPDNASDWMDLNIVVTGKPQITSISPSVINLDSKFVACNIDGANFYPGIQIFLINKNVKKIIKQYKINSTGNISIYFSPKDYGSGVFNLQLVNKGNYSSTAISVLSINDSVTSNTEKNLSQNLKKETNNKLLSAVIGSDLELLKKIIEGGASPNSADSKGFYAVHYAASMGNIDILKYLVLKGANIQIKDIGGATALHHACFGGHFNAVKYLVDEQNLNVNEKTTKGYVPLDRAAINGHSEVISYLLKKSVKINSQASNGETALHLACYSGNLDSVKLISSYPGCNVNIKESRGFTPLHYSAYYGYTPIAEYLIVNRKADLSVLAKNWQTPYELAVISGNDKTASMIKSKG